MDGHQEIQPRQNGRKARNKNPQRCRNHVRVRVGTRKTVERIAPQVDPPRSWDKDEKEEWALLPASVRAAITRRENDRDKELRRLQNKAATNGAATKSVESKIKDIENDCTAKRI